MPLTSRWYYCTCVPVYLSSAPFGQPAPSALGSAPVACLTQEEWDKLTLALPARLSCTGGLVQAAPVALNKAQPTPVDVAWGQKRVDVC